MKIQSSGQTSSRNKSRPLVADPDKNRDTRADVPAVRNDAVPEATPEPGDLSTREQKIAIIAYYKAQRRGFANSGELDDWLEAEREVDRNGVDKTRPQT